MSQIFRKVWLIHNFFWNFQKNSPILKILNFYVWFSFLWPKRRLKPKFQVPSFNFPKKCFLVFDFLKHFRIWWDFLQEISKLSNFVNFVYIFDPKHSFMQNFSSLSFDVTTQGAIKVFKKSLKNLLFINCLSRPA